MKVALFTSYHPAIGGGAVNFRSLLPRLEGCEVTWFHLGAATPGHPEWVSLGAPMVGGALRSDWWRSAALWLGAANSGLDRMARQMLAANADRHWVLAMDEGIPLGRRLRRLAPHVPLHVSIQDDQEFGMYGRSRRYRWVARLTRRPLRRLLQEARSVDVTSDGMEEYYARRLGLRSTVVHPFVAAAPAPEAARDPRCLTVGHVGSVYAAEELRVMLAGLKLAANRLGRRPAGRFIGLLPRLRPIVEEAGIEAEMPGFLAEPEAVRQLAACDFLYAMYPFDGASRVFACTSLPTKLTTYVQAARPVLAHAPAESTLARMVTSYGVGTGCTETTPEAIAGAILAAVAGDFPVARFQAWREACYGPDNAERLGRLLREGRAT